MLSVVFVLVSLAPVGGPPVDPPRPAAYELEWRAPEGCPDAAAVRAAVEALLSGEPEGEGVMVVTATVTESPPTWRLTLDTEFAGSTGSREVSADSCAELGSSVALVIAATLDPAVEGGSTPPAGPPEPEPEPEPTHSAAPLGVTSANPPTARTRSYDRTPRVRLRVDAGPEWGALTRLAGTLGFATVLHWEPARVELGGRWIGLDRRDGGRGTQVAMQVFTLAARGCGQLHWAGWEFPLCAGLEAGTVRIDRRGFTANQRLLGPWVAPVFAGAATHRWGPVALWIEAQMAVRARGTTASSGGTRLFSATAPVSLRPLLGIELFLP